jgi:pyridoxine kinase
MNILSIQSWVAYGHVGNAAAIFPLQRLGAEVWGVHSVQFSNHTGYGSWAGKTFPAATIEQLIEGIAARGVLGQCDAILSGYLGDPDTGQVVLRAAARIRAANPHALWCCDPVIGDVGPGSYVKPGVAEFLAQRAVPQADILTPNGFELARLTGLPVSTLSEACTAVHALRGMMRPDGPRAVLVTSLATSSTPADALDLMAASSESIHVLRVPRLKVAANGAGDVIAALFLFHLRRTGSAALALEWAASSLHGVLRATEAAGAPEMLLIAAQDELVAPSIRFTAQFL